MREFEWLGEGELVVRGSLMRGGVVDADGLRARGLVPAGRSTVQVLTDAGTEQRSVWVREGQTLTLDE